MQIKGKIDIGEALEVAISNTDAEENPRKAVANLHYLGQDENSFTCQVSFVDTSVISTDVNDPDQLSIIFTRPEYFMDKETGYLLQKDDALFEIFIRP